MRSHRFCRATGCAAIRPCRVDSKEHGADGVVARFDNDERKLTKACAEGLAMATKRFGGGLALAALLTLLASGNAGAGPYLGEWSWFWYRAGLPARCLFTAALLGSVGVSTAGENSSDQRRSISARPSGAPGYEAEKHPCQSTPPAPLTPYADPRRFRPTDRAAA